MTVELDALEALAEAATPGPWEADTNHPFSADLQGVFAPDQRRYVVKADMDQQPENGIDPVFIAAADPSTILALVAELRQERERADKYQDLTRRTELQCQDAEADLSRAEEPIERMNALLAPVLKRVDREQIGTHGPDCHTWHLGCLALAIERALTEYGKQNGADDDE